MCSLRILYFPFCTSAVAYTVALGLFLAVGRETTGKIPQGKVRAPENFFFRQTSRFDGQIGTTRERKLPDFRGIRRKKS